MANFGDINTDLTLGAGKVPRRNDNDDGFEAIGVIQLAPDASTDNVIQPTGAAIVPFTIKGAASQSANLLELQDSGGTVLSGVSSGGIPFTGTSVTSGTVGYSSEVTSSATSGSVFNYYGRIIANSAGSQTIYGFHSIALCTSSSGTFTGWYFGLNGIAHLSSDGATMNRVAGVRGYVLNNKGTATGTIVTGIGVVAEGAIANAAHEITNYYAFRAYECANSGGGTLTNQYGLYIGNFDNGTNNWAIVTNAGNIVFNEGGDANSDFRVEGDTNANLLFVDASADKVGIGTNSPARGLHLSGTGLGAVVMIEATDTGDPSLTILNSNQSYEVGISSTDSDAFRIRDLTASGDPTRLYITTGGLIGINQTSPGAMLQIDTSAAATKGLIVKGAASQSGNLTEWQDSSGNLLASIGSSGNLVATPDEITATSGGVAASVATVNTEVTTNGDSDLDNVTLANGTSGQIKHIYCVAEGNAADTWKITPATMCGGTQITFSGVGEGCTLVYADNEGWVVVANNGGTIT